MIETAQHSLGLLFSWPYILYPIVGTLLSMLFAGLPGIGGATLMALLLPFLYGMEPEAAMLLLGALVGGGTFMGSVSAILLGIPGKPANAATVLDGYPMAQQGYAKTALGCAAAASALGSTIGVAGLLAVLPFLRRVLLSFGPSEFLAVSVWALATVVLATRGSIWKAALSGAFGLALTFIGIHPITGAPRLTLGSLYLLDGLDLVLVILGVFSLGEVMSLVDSRKATISGLHRVEELRGSVRDGIRSIIDYPRIFLQSSFVGTVVGMIPGIGGTIGGFIAYGLAARGPSTESFGTGDIRGVLAPESANDAKDGGSLAPALLFGIPSGASTAVLLVALEQAGVAPGQQLVEQHMDYVLLLVFSLFVSNWLTSVAGLAMVRPFSLLTVVPIRVLAPVLLVVTLGGTYVYRHRIEDMVTVCVFGLIGYGMKQYNWPRVPFVTGLVLGSLLETNLLLTIQLHEVGRVVFWERPITLSLAALTALSLYWIRHRTDRARAQDGSQTPYDPSRRPQL